MALSQLDALDAVKAILDGPRAYELPRLERIAEALKPTPESCAEFTPTVQIPADAPPLMKELARKSQTNYLPLLVKTFGQVIKVEGYFSASDEGADDPWTWWQRNRMDARQTGLTRSALQYGAAYATALPGQYGRGEPGPVIGLHSPRTMTAVYQDPECDEWPMLALALDVDGQGYETLRLFDEEMVYSFGIERGPWPSGIYPASSVALQAGRLLFIDAQAHDTGVCPVVRYRDRNLLAGEEQMGIVEPLFAIQERIHETSFEMMVAQYFAAFRQRYVLGWVPKNEQEELKAGAARIWYLDEDPADVSIGELGETDLTRYLDSAASAKRDFAAIGQIPAQWLGVDAISNISDATLAGLEAAKNREAGEITESLGESHEQLLRLCAYIAGNQSAADDYSSETRWADFESRSFAQTVDGLVKLASGLGLPGEIALEDVPGMTPQKLKRAQDAIRRAKGASVLQMLQSASAAAPTPPTAPPAPPVGPQQPTPTPAGVNGAGVPAP